VLGVQVSASLRESLIEQLAAINSADEAAAWAHRNLPAKNTLTAADAKIVEERFQARLSKISDGEEASEGTTPRSTPDHPGAHGPPPTVADKSVLAVGGLHSGAGHKGSGLANKQPRSEVVHALGKTLRLRDKESTAGSYSGSPVLCAAACHRIHITSRLHSPCTGTTGE
jgi:hypothetical protein